MVLSTISSTSRQSTDSSRLPNFTFGATRLRTNTALSIDGDEALKIVTAERTVQISEEEYNAVKRKLDWIIPPLCALVYLNQYLDKTTLNYASIMGFPITGERYNLVAMAFYIGFLVWEFPTMFIAHKSRLGKYLGMNVVLWGVVLMLHAVPTTFGPFFALRFILGMLESCAAPVQILITTMFYKKNEQSMRVAWWYLQSGTASVVGGLLAYGISFTTDGSIAAWRILYLVFGGMAVVVGIMVLVWLPDSPLHTWMLSEDEKIIALERVREDQMGTENRKIKKDQVIEAFTDIRTWIIALMIMLTSIPNGGLANFSNLIIKSFGYSTRETLLLSMPSGIVAVLWLLLLSHISDKTGERMVPIALTVLPTVVGAAILIGLNGTDHKGALLFAIYIISCFGGSVSFIYAYNAGNISGHTKKVTVNALTLVSFSIGNIIGTETFQAKDAPSYIPGKLSIMILLAIEFFLCFLMRWINVRENRKKRLGLEELKRINEWSDEDMAKDRERHAFWDMTDKQNPYFTYTL
ncbi:MFS general substrate transporter [Gloeophyllum trabeum ATCC 11539]|uniref:MFS general substrate transporter n=1 Tax=Gloeophyllum trabeum (strain ATCC 11539 / FP-39264 / Madison 617) TaxID=670483 RepID=S7QIX1_GLOTA|nr:MFS general substrate transporter [Gloeophyllum trabeum ATCC 11539]EPQ59297.1 MFS general substrate transporter [Gloeophyllum trabeum ATCC 11539]